MNYFKTVLSLCFWGLFGVSSLLADSEAPVSSRIRFDALTLSAGLSSDQVLDIIPDLNRNIWLASNNGLNQFDGYTVIKYGKKQGSIEHLSSNHLTSIAAKKNSLGSLWIGTLDRGINRFDPVTGKSEWFNLSSAKGRGLLSDSILQLGISEEKFLWIGTNNGLNVLNLVTHNIRSIEGDLKGEEISCISVLSDDQVWVGTRKGRLFRWNVQSSSFDKIWDAGVKITSLVIDNRNEVWIGTLGRGLFRYTFGSSKDPMLSKLEQKDVTCLFNDHNGVIWAGTRHGLARFDQKSGLFTVFTNDPRDPNSLVDNHVTKIVEDKSKVLWVSTLRGGACYFKLDRLTFPQIRNTGVHSSVRSLHRSKVDDSIWIGTEKGISKWSSAKKEISLPVQDEHVQGSYIVSILEDSLERLWLGTKGEGLFLIEKSGKVIHFHHDAEQPASLPHNFVTKAFEDSTGLIWIATSGGGICQYQEDLASFTPVLTSKGSDLTYAFDIAESQDGKIWVAAGAGLFVRTHSAAQFRSYKEVYPDFKAPSSLDSAITTILPDDNGIIWVGTFDKGFLRINSFTGDQVAYNTTSTINKMPSDQVRALMKDLDNNLWISTMEGITKFNISKGDFRSFHPEDGLQEKGFHKRSVARGNGKTLYFGGSDGFNIITSDKLPDLKGAPTPFLTGLDYLGKPVIPGKGKVLEEKIAIAEEIVIPFDRRNQFSISFGNVGERSSTRGVFRYMLSPFESEWQIAKLDHRAHYSSLPPGKYTFRVQSSRNGEDYDGIETRINVIITPQWWSTWWFRLLVSITLIVGTVLTSRFVIHSRMKQIQRREESFIAQRDHAEAALARQLQHSMLIERTAQEFQEGMEGNQVLSDSMKNFAEQFGASHCLIHQLIKDASGQSKLSLVGHYSERNLNFSDGLQIDADLPFCKKTLESNEVVVFARFNEIPERLLEFFDKASATSDILAVRTTFLDQPNGIIILQRTNNDKPWGIEKVKLLHALSPQFGIAIAQISTAKKEEEYRDHLHEARHDAEVANRAKSDFLAKMTHELRTPLNAIIGFTEIIQEDNTLNTQQRDLINIVNDAGEHLHDVINDILDLSKIEAGKLEENNEIFEFAPMLKSVHEMLRMKAAEKQIDFDFQALTALPGQIETDKSKLRQTMINLLNNAIKFTPAGSVTLKVGASMLSEPKEKDGKMRRGVRINFNITDTGVGIETEEIPKLFVKYSQTESGRRSAEEGTGLGLPIAKSFIKLLGGDIHVESELGKGSSFIFYIDCEEVAVDTSSDEKISMALSESKAQKINGFSSDLDEVRILIAEDQPTNRLLLRKILGKAGFKIEEAINGQEAIDRWKDWHPHLILMDEDMPIMRGSDATKIIKAEVEEGSIEIDPVIVSLTAYALEQARKSAFEAGVQDFVAKPFRSHELFSVISKHLGIDYTFTDVA